MRQPWGGLQFLLISLDFLVFTYYYLYGSSKILVLSWYVQIVAETVTEVGDPKKAICAAVEKLNIELLVLGSHGRGTIQRYLL